MWSNVFILLCDGSRTSRKVTIKTHDALNLLDDFSEIGVKAVSLISDGESTLSKLIFHLFSMRRNGIDIGNATNVGLET